MAIGADGIEVSGDPQRAARVDLEPHDGCDFCDRAFPAGFTIACSGSMQACPHCYFTAGFGELTPELVEPMDAEAWRERHGAEPTALTEGERLEKDGLLAYLRLCLPTHDAATCRWRPRCFLCEVRAIGLALDDAGAVDAWLRRHGYEPAAPPLDLARVARWFTLDAAERRALATALAASLLEPFVAEERDGAPVLVHVPSRIELVVAVAGRSAPLLLGRTPLTVAQATHLRGPGAPVVPAAAADPTPWTGFDLHALPAVLQSGGFRLPTAAEWASAARPDRDTGARDLIGGVDQLVNVTTRFIETVGGSARRDPASVERWTRAAGARTLVPDRWPIEDLTARDFIGRPIPSAVPDHVGVRLALSLT